MSDDIETFGDPGRIQGALDDNQCPRCLIKLPEPKENGVTHCLVCRLEISDNFPGKGQRFDVLMRPIVVYLKKVRSKLSII